MQYLSIKKQRQIGEIFFKMRDYTPVPFIILMLFIAKPSVVSATMGILLVLFGEIIRIYSVSFIGRVSRTRNSHTGDNLITKGPFAIIRNPLYLGNFFITLGIASYSGQVFFVLLMFLLFCVQYYFIVSYEEGLLEKDYGEQYLNYKSQVPSFIPKNKINFSSLESPLNFKMALESEKRTLTSICTVLILILYFS